MDTPDLAPAGPHMGLVPPPVLFGPPASGNFATRTYFWKWGRSSPRGHFNRPPASQLIYAA